MHASARDGDASVPIQVGIRQVNGQQGIVFLHRRTQQHRPVIIQKYFLPREEPGPLMEHTLCAPAHRLNVAIPVEHAEGFSMLEHTRPVIGHR